MIGECVSEATAERGNELAVHTTQPLVATKTLTEEVDVAIIGERIGPIYNMYYTYTYTLVQYTSMRARVLYS